MKIEQATCSRCKSEGISCVYMPNFVTMTFYPLCRVCDPQLFKRASELQKEKWLKGEDVQ